MDVQNTAGQIHEGGIMARVFEVVFGCFLGLGLLKFGNPAMFDSLVDWPVGGMQWAINSWPLTIGYGILIFVILVGLFCIRGREEAPDNSSGSPPHSLSSGAIQTRKVIARSASPHPGPLPRGEGESSAATQQIKLDVNSRVSKKKWCKWLLALPLVWLGWQLISATNTVDRELTGLTVRYFFGCVACFYLGYGCLSGGKLTWRFWLPILTAVGLVMAVGFEQHFGGLEDTHRYFYTYVYPHLKTVPPELVKKMNSSRIFSTLFYPNALAGVLLLLLPPLSVMLWRIGDRMTAAARGLLIGLLWVGGMGCLYWSGSKGGWLLQLILFVIALMHLSVPKRLKLTVVVAFMVVGLAGFAVKYARFFEKGATSVVARFDYWRAAAQTVASKPILGSGPGTFGPVYARIKNPDAEMARLVHNDYLEQASDSGIPGFLAYLGFVVGALWYGYPAPKSAENWLRFGVWLGLVGWALQGVSEFGLYIPALSWTAFSLMGWLVRTGGNRIDKTVPA